ncbi:hypothetical protein C0Q70_20694 [Pomacea canaliculata]|uniref:Uncharacterized protein n=1 Tax=Pomacea canaliculata TaxID=400727 RepID=A0A2T7NGA9_POMCA|nr:hypothetical protein C0Q70_20694 [Pomacea canaliculata]
MARHRTAWRCSGLCTLLVAESMSSLRHGGFKVSLFLPHTGRTRLESGASSVELTKMENLCRRSFTDTIKPTARGDAINSMRHLCKDECSSQANSLQLGV